MGPVGAAAVCAIPNICLQMLLRGRNTVGYTPYPTAVTDAFVAEAAATGVDVFRIFDALNDVSQMRPAINAALHRNRAPLPSPTVDPASMPVNAPRRPGYDEQPHCPP